MYVPLDVNAPENPKILEAGDHAELVFYRSLCLAKRLERDGRIARSQLRLLGATPEDATTLVRVGLWAAEEGGWCIPSFLVHNLSAAQLKERRDAERRRKAEFRQRKAATPQSRVARRGTKTTVPPDVDGVSQGCPPHEEKRREEIRSEESGGAPIADEAPADTVLEAARRQWHPRVDNDEIATAIETARALGHHDADIIEAIRKSMYPSHLTKELPKRRGSNDPARPTEPTNYAKCPDCGSALGEGIEQCGNTKCPTNIAERTP